MRTGGIRHNGVEDEVRCPKCGHFFTAVKPALQRGQRVFVHCKKCFNKEEVIKI